MSAKKATIAVVVALVGAILSLVLGLAPDRPWMMASAAALVALAARTLEGRDPRQVDVDHRAASSELGEVAPVNLIGESPSVTLYASLGPDHLAAACVDLIRRAQLRREGERANELLEVRHRDQSASPYLIDSELRVRAREVLVQEKGKGLQRVVAPGYDDLPELPRDRDGDGSHVVNALKNAIVGAQDRSGEDGVSLRSCLLDNHVFERSPHPFQGGAVEAGDLGRAVGHVEGVPVGTPHLVVCVPPRDVLASTM